LTAPVAVDVVRVRPGGDALPLPRYMTPDAAGMDLRADLEAEIVLAPGERRLVPTGLAVAIPPGFEGQVRARSGLAARDGLTVLNAPGRSTPTTAARCRCCSPTWVASRCASSAATASRSW